MNRRWDVGPSTFLALPEDGARLINWHINMSDGSVRDVIHWPEESAEDSFLKSMENSYTFSICGKMFPRR